MYFLCIFKVNIKCFTSKTYQKIYQNQQLQNKKKPHMRPPRNQVLACPLLASEYLNSKEVSTMYFLICWGHFISKIALLQYVIRIAFFGGSLMVNLSFTIKDPPFFPIRDF